MNSPPFGGGDKRGEEKSMCPGRVYFILMTVYYGKIKSHGEEALLQSSAGAAYLGQSCSSFTFRRLNRFRAANSTASGGLTSCHLRSPKRQIRVGRRQLVNTTPVTISSFSSTRFFKKTRIYTSKRGEVLPFFPGI